MNGFDDQIECRDERIPQPRYPPSTQLNHKLTRCKQNCESCFIYRILDSNKYELQKMPMSIGVVGNGGELMLVQFAIVVVPSHR